MRLAVPFVGAARRVAVADPPVTLPESTGQTDVDRPDVDPTDVDPTDVDRPDAGVDTPARPEEHPPAPSAERPRRGASLVPYALAAILCAAYSIVSVSRHLHLQTGGFDVGLFEQAVRGYAHLRAPVADLRAPGFNLLGDHFHPILILLAPVYRVFPSAITLLVAQAAAIALSVVPVTRAATREVGRLGGPCVGIAYGLSWGLQEAIGFDFHEVAFAVPLVAFSLERLIRGEYRAAAWWCVPLVCVKEDLGITVAAIGAVLFLRRQRRLGAALAAFGVAATALATFVLVPAFNIRHQYGFWGHMNEGPDAGRDSPLDIALHLLDDPAKRHTLWLLLIPTLLLALRSPLVLVAAPTMLWRFATGNPFYWTDGYHYSAVLMPVVFLAFVDALPMLTRNRLPWVRAVGRLVVAGVLVVGVVLSVHRPVVAGLRDPATWRHDARAAAIRHELDRIPDGATVGSSNKLAAQLTSRCTVYLLPDFRADHHLRPDWVVVGTGGDWPLSAEDQEQEIVMLKVLGYREVVRRPGLVMLRRG